MQARLDQLRGSERQEKSDQKDKKMRKSQLLSDYVEDYLLYKKCSKHSEKSIAYSRESMKRVIKIIGDRPLEEIDTSVLRSLVLRLEGAEWTIWGTCSVMRAFYNFLMSEGEIEVNPWEKVSMPKQPNKIMPALSMEEVEILLKNVKSEKPRLMLHILLDTGIRLSEMVGLKVGDLKDDSLLIRGKGGKERMAFLSPITLRMVMKACRGKREEDSILGISLFHSTRVIRRMGEPYGIHVHAHKLRRTFCIMMLRRGCDIFTLQRMMGHSTIIMLRRYLDQNTEDVSNAHKKYSLLR